MCPARIKLDLCDILTVKADVCISSVHRSRNMKVFPLSKHILKASGEDVQKELFNNGSEKLTMGQVEMTDAGRLKNFKKLLFICLRSYIEKNEEFLLQSLAECLELAAVAGHTSVAVPALGTGGLKYPPEKVAKATVEAVALHNLQYGGTTTIQTVNIVLLDNDTELIKTYLTVCVSGSTNLKDNELDKTEPGSQADGSAPDVKSATATNTNSNSNTAASSTNTRQRVTPPPPVKTNNSLVRPSGFLSVLQSLLKIGFTHRIGLFKFTVRPSFDGKFAGLSFDAGIDVAFLANFIPPPLMDFFNNLGKSAQK